MAEIGMRYGRPIVSMTDHKGIENDYYFTRAEADGVTTFTLEKVGSEKVYKVRHWPGTWTCSCPAYGFSPGPFKTCKHVLKVREVVDFLDSMLTMAGA